MISCEACVGSGRARLLGISDETTIHSKSLSTFCSVAPRYDLPVSLTVLQDYCVYNYQSPQCSEFEIALNTSTKLFKNLCKVKAPLDARHTYLVVTR